jgi:hypothetical protein
MKEQSQRRQEMAQSTPTTGGVRPSEARNPTAAGIIRQSLEETSASMGARNPPGMG